MRTLRTEEQSAYLVGRFVALQHQPYTGAAAFAVKPLAAEGLGTFAVDPHWRLYMDPVLLAGPDRWSPQVLGGVILHEYWHLLRDHSGRARDLHPLDHQCWNLATDAAINEMLLRAGLSLPEGVVTPQSLGLTPGRVEEIYYRELVARAGGGVAMTPGCGCGSGAGMPSPPWQSPGDMAPVVEVGRANGIRRDVARQVQREFGNRGRGTMPDSLKRWVDAELAPPKVAWQELLNGAVCRAVVLAQGATDFDRRRPSRRSEDGDFWRPALRGPRLSVAMVVDTSGSMSQAEIDAAMAEVAGIFLSAGVDRSSLWLVSCDATAHVGRYNGPGSVELVGGGGTNMCVGIAAAAALPSRPDVIVVLTDGETPWPEERTAAHLIVVLIGAGGSSVKPPAWATTVRIREMSAA